MTANTSTATIRMRDRIPAQALIEEVLGGAGAGSDAAAWYRAAQGQRLVAGLLAHLPVGWTVFHSMPVADGEDAIDHVVVGPAGVLPVTTVHHPGRRMTVAGRVVTVAGHRLPTVLGAEADGDRLGRLLATHGLGAVPVHPVVAVAGATRLTVKERPRGVAVLPAESLRHRLLEKAPILDTDGIASVVDLLDRPDVWRATAEAQPDLLRRFTELEDRMRPGRLGALLPRRR